ncbi:hypothetical protein FPQ18DRAFT_332700 [Pyronema domesticum]|nr:hypothetical protein FPQ18DRAFT_332700 [Pyronema domesticum]
MRFSALSLSLLSLALGTLADNYIRPNYLYTLSQSTPDKAPGTGYTGQAKRSWWDSNDEIVTIAGFDIPSTTNCCRMEFHLPPKSKGWPFTVTGKTPILEYRLLTIPGTRNPQPVSADVTWNTKPDAKQSSLSGWIFLKNPPSENDNEGFATLGQSMPGSFEGNCKDYAGKRVFIQIKIADVAMPDGGPRPEVSEVMWWQLENPISGIWMVAQECAA